MYKTKTLNLYFSPYYIRYTVYLILIFLLYTLYLIPNTTHAATIGRPMSNAGLVGYWPFEDSKGSATAYDRSGRGNHGTINGAVGTSSVAGLGGALYFDGSDDYVNVPDSSSLNVSQITISLWVLPSFGACWCDVLSKESSDYSVSGYGIRVSGSDQITFTLNIGGSKVELLSAGWTSGQWQHVVGVYDGSTLSVYKNGVFSSSVGASGSITNSSNNLNIARRVSNSDRNTRAILDDVRIYNRALSADEIKRLYNLKKPRVSGGVSNTGLVGYWKMDEMTGTVAGDSSGNKNNGTLTGGPTWVDGKINSAVNFDGSNDFVVSATSTIVSQSNVTIAYWSRGTGAPFGEGVVGDGQAGFWDGSRLFFRGSGGSQDFVVTNPSSSGVWSHIAIVRTPTSVDVYNNGVIYSTNGSSNMGYIVGQNPGVQLMHIGSSPCGTGCGQSFFTGQIDEFRVYNRALPASEIKALYEGSKATVLNKTNTTSVRNGLVGHWTFDGKDMYSTTALDRSGNGSNGTLTNGPFASIGKIGQALTFDGTDDYVDFSSFPTGVPTGASARAYSFWMYTRNSSSRSYIIHHGEGIWGEFGVMHARGGPTQIELELGGKAAGFDSPVPFLNQWRHVVVTFNGSEASFYVDGSLIGTTSTANTFGGGDLTSINSSTSGGLDIGQRNNGTFRFTGIIDDVRIYNRAITLDEVKALYNMGR